MPATRDGKTWRSQFYYEDWQGVRHKKNKRGFKTKAEAEEWERNFRQQQQKDLEINFENFVEIYFADMENRLRESTIKNKRYVFDLKVTPYFKKKYQCAILLIGHMNKASGNKAAYRGMGSIDFFAVARSVLLVGRIEGEPNTRAVVQIKNNLAAFGHPKAFMLSEMDNIVECVYNMDNGYVEVWFTDGNMLRIKCEEVEAALRTTEQSLAKLHRLLDNKPIEYVAMAMAGEMQAYEYMHEARVLVSSMGKTRYNDILKVVPRIETNNSSIDIIGDTQFERDYYGKYTNEYQIFIFINGNNMVQGIVRLLIEHKEKKENELRQKMFSGIALSGIKVFISYHYQCDNKVAKEITNIVNKDRTSLFTILQEQVKKNDSESIKRWVDEEIKKTRFTILLISKETFEREYVSYEITRSRENGNTIIPILIDNEENAFSEEDIETLSKKLPKTNCKRIRRWIKDCGKENVLQWLNDALGV